jgi:PilZ domain
VTCPSLFCVGADELAPPISLGGVYNGLVQSEPPESRRRSPRIEVYAQAEVKSCEIHIMDVRNLSAGGVYLVGTPEAYPELRPGTNFDLVIFGSEDGMGDDPDFNVACHATIIRIDEGTPGKRPPGFGATLAAVDEENRLRLTNLLLRADNYRVGDPRR